jgi:hypothetical protein
LVTNGDFESGNNGFTTAYVLAAQASDGLVPEGAYDVVAHPSSRHPSFCYCGDKTSGSGLQMVVNGAGSESVIWSQTVNVVPNTAYQFTYWEQTVVNGNDSNPSKIQLFVNGGNAGPIYTANPQTGVWTQFTYNWTSGSGVTKAILELKNENFAAGGNDFALDDIVFEQACEATASVSVTVNSTLPASVSIAAVPSGAICSGTSVTFTATPTNGGAAPTYQWYNGASAISGATNSSYTSTTLSNGNVITVKMASNMTCATGSPATSPGITMTVNPLPTAFNLTGGGLDCSGSLGVGVGLSGSQNGVNYQLYKDGVSAGTPVAGTGSAISFGNQLAGTYTVKAINASTSCELNMTGSAIVVGDTENPVISCPATASVACSSDLPVVTTITEFKNLGGNVSDNCTAEASLILSTSDVIDLNSGCRVNRTYTITDASGNSATCVQVFTINDATKPVITCNADLVSSPNTDACEANINVSAPTAISENCSLVNINPEYSYRLGDNPVATLVTGSGSINETFPEGTTTITWTITDLCGNTSEPCTQTVQVGFNLTSVSYDNGSGADGLGSGVKPMQTSTHEYFVDNNTPESGYTYNWGLFEDDGTTAVNSSLYTISSVNAAHIKIEYATISTGNYILSVTKTKNATTCSKPQTLPIEVISNSSFDVALDDLGNQCQAPGGGLTTISWNVTFPDVVTEPFMFSYSIKLGGSVVATGNVTDITYAGAIPTPVLAAGAQTSKTANSQAVVIYYSLYGVSGDDWARTVELEIIATDAYQVSEPNKTNNTDDLKIHQVPVITFN